MTTWIPPDNIPAPLHRPPAPFLEAGRWQMSFGERAALIGLLSELRPRLSLEIGTYDGGSLVPIAAHSVEVHTVDLDALVPDRERFENVTFHVGDSREVLPRLLLELEQAGRAIDFAMVDGDHSTDGVWFDIVTLLAAESARETVIVLHDTLNPVVRAGIERAQVETHQRVVYFEPDFVPGYEFRDGHFDGEIWGGLGLIVTGPERADRYRASPRQTRYVEAFTARAHASALNHEATQLRQQVASEREARRRLEASLSWRVTTPLRAVKRRLGRQLPP